MSTGTSLPSISELVLAAKKIVWKAKKEGTLKTLTPRIIRQRVEKEKSIQEGILDSSEYKNPLKDAIVAAMSEEPPASDNEKETEKKTEKIKAEDEILKKGPPKAQDKRSANASTKKKGKAEEASKVEEKADGEATPSPKKTTTPKSKPKPKAKTKSKSRVVVGDTDDDDDDDEEEEEEPESAQDFDSEEEWGTPQKKRKTAGKPKAKARKVQSDFEEEEDEEKLKKGKLKSKKVTKEPPSKTKPTSKKAPTTKENEDTKSKFKSLEHVPTSDMEQDEPGPEAGPSNTKIATKNAETPVKKTPTKRKASTAADIPTPSTTPRKKAVSSTSKAKPETKPKSTSVNESQAKKSDTELSDLVDEPPKKKRRSSSGKEKATKTKEKKKSKGPALTKDEDTIKRLKSFVVACGTRKVWSKVFKDLDTPQQQIKKLKEMLAELGMTGRMSMEQAKAIKEKREFEQELEDVKEFANKFTGRSSRSRDGGKATSTSPNDGHESGNEQNDEDESDEEVVRKPKTTARRSIMAFLEDQSDDDE